MNLLFFSFKFGHFVVILEAERLNAGLKFSLELGLLYAERKLANSIYKESRAVGPQRNNYNNFLLFLKRHSNTKKGSFRLVTTSSASLKKKKRLLQLVPISWIFAGLFKGRNGLLGVESLSISLTPKHLNRQTLICFRGWSGDGDGD